MKQIFLVLSFYLLLQNSHFAQSSTPEVVAASGDSYSNGQGSVSWTLGEISTETYSSANNKLTQGFQQPRLLLIGINEKKNVPSITAYPNPVKDLLLVDLKSLPEGTYTLEMYDATGRLVSKTIQQKNNTAQLVTVGMKQLSNGTYYLNVLNATANYSVSYQITKAE